MSDSITHQVDEAMRLNDVRFLIQNVSIIDELGIIDDLTKWASGVANLSVLNACLKAGCKLSSATGLRSALMNGYLAVLQWWKKSRVELRYPADSFEIAASLGRVDILEWLMSSKVPVPSQICLDNVLKKRNFDILDWLKTLQNVKFNCSMEAMMKVAYNGDISLINWLHVNREFMTPGSTLRDHMYHFMAAASVNNQIGPLRWWKNYYGTVGISEAIEFSITNASKKGHVEILDWWKNESGSSMSIDTFNSFIINTDHLPVLDWALDLARKSKQSFDHHVFLRRAMHKRSITLLDWWIKSMSGHSCTCDLMLMNYAAGVGSCDVIDWLFIHSKEIYAITGQTIEISHDMMRAASVYDHIDVLDWCASFAKWHDIKMPWAHQILEELSKPNTTASQKVIDWWSALLKAQKEKIKADREAEEARRAQAKEEERLKKLAKKEERTREYEDKLLEKIIKTIVPKLEGKDSRVAQLQEFLSSEQKRSTSYDKSIFDAFVVENSASNQEPKPLTASNQEPKRSISNPSSYDESIVEESEDGFIIEDATSISDKARLWYQDK